MEREFQKGWGDIGRTFQVKKSSALYVSRSSGFVYCACVKNYRCVFFFTRGYFEMGGEIGLTR